MCWHAEWLCNITSGTTLLKGCRPLGYTVLFFIRCWGTTRVMTSSYFKFLDHTHNDAPQSVGLLWTGDQPDAKRSLPDNTQHKQETNNYVPGGIRTNNPSWRAAVDPRLRLRHQVQKNFIVTLLHRVTGLWNTICNSTVLLTIKCAQFHSISFNTSQDMNIYLLTYSIQHSPSWKANWFCS